MIQLQLLMLSHDVRKFPCTFSDTLHGIFMYFFVMFSLKVNGIFCKPFLIGTWKCIVCMHQENENFTTVHNLENF